MNKLIRFLLLIPILWSGYELHAQDQKRYTISGYLEDASSGEKLISAKVFDSKTRKGTLTNNFGFFSLTLPEGPVSLVATYSGFQTISKELNLTMDLSMNFSLKEFQVDEVMIVAENEERIEEKTEMSVVDIPIQQIKLLPALLGEVDVIKAVQLMPGVQSGNEGSTGLYVRGGGPDQNLILLDDVPLYYVSHLGGFFSVFNADAIKSVKLTKGGFPARYGGRLSSVLDIRMKEGNMNEFHGEGSIGLISSKLSLQGPIIKGKSSFIISGRRTYLDLFSKPISRIATKGQTSFGYHFYDLNGKVNHTFSDKDRLYFSFYLGDDNLSISNNEKEGNPGEEDFYEFRLKNKTLWGNKMAALRWNHIWSPKLFSNLTATYSKYRFNADNDLYDAYSYRQNDSIKTNVSEGSLGYKSGIEDFGAKLDFDFYPAPSHAIKFGAASTYHTFTPGLLGLKFKTGETNLDTTLNNQKANSLESYVYIEDEFKIGEKFSANVGVHGVHYLVNKKSYYSLQPRASARLLVGEKVALKASYVQMTQFIHLLSNSGAGLPIDLWVPATEKVAPQTSWQAAAGIATSFLDGQLSLSIEGYYKEMNNMIEYKEGTDFFLGVDDKSWEERVETGGKGTAYGAEILLQKKTGKTTGWVGYTLSWNNRQFANINGGNVYPYKYDRRHDFSAVVSHQLTEKISVAGTWVYGTGNAITLASGGYGSIITPFGGLPNQNYGSYAEFFNGGEFFEGGVKLYENGRNGFRMQAYHRLDLGINFTKKKKWGERTWSISVYNAYNRLNPYTYILRRKFNQQTGTFDQKKLTKIALFPVIPSISYAFKF
ncbi:MAG: carboxypeptidase-like regulatory domain-containing protein [Bacteroidota bacterium]